MALSFAEAVQCLLKGSKLEWAAFEAHHGGSISLATPEQRRLFDFLLRQDRAKVARGDEALFGELIEAWKNDGVDPASKESEKPTGYSSDIWRLDKIEAFNFGGLTLFGGPPFELRVSGQNWCLNGQNGSGKTSLASAVLWALTGKRIREHEGPIDEYGERSAVTNEIGVKIGDWPSLASYPTTAADLSKSVEVWVRLSFVNQTGEGATALRRMVCPSNGDPIQEATIDPRLLTSPELLETGLLMPARLTRIGFGNKSGSLYDAVKMLTGLDQLSDIADGCGQLTHRGRRFLKYGRDQGIELIEEKFAEELKKAEQIANELTIPLPENRKLGANNLAADLNDAASNNSAKAGSYLETLKSEITPKINTTDSDGRTAIRRAVGVVRAVVQQGTNGIPVFEALAALKEAQENEKFAALPQSMEKARVRLTQALLWHGKQSADQKFRLKALAAQFFIPPHEHTSIAQCPLCSAELTTEEQQVLATELSELKESAAEAERRLEDVCFSLERDLEAQLPSELRSHLNLLATMQPRTAFVATIRQRFCEESPFQDVLIGLASEMTTKTQQAESKLPVFSFPDFEDETELPEAAVNLRRYLHKLDRISALVKWWSENRSYFRNAWSDVIGRKQPDDSYPTDSVEGKLFLLEEALAKAEPFDALSRSLTSAAKAAESWNAIRDEQKQREAIAANLEPLKNLRILVATETARSIANLSDRIKAILERIHLRERLNFEHTSLDKKTIQVDGSFEPGMQIDAALVANTSWLRAILWAFIFALREETIESFGTNPFPLMVLDDPQTSFDPRNKRKWAEELTRLANMDHSSQYGLQLFLTTHERQFFQLMVDIEKLEGEGIIYLTYHRPVLILKIKEISHGPHEPDLQRQRRGPRASGVHPLAGWSLLPALRRGREHQEAARQVPPPGALCL